ncbi:MAG: hypothetical protein R3301_15330, partial [Saprospiraceae bacterium]|nr:hypothetical protein [Saprospiraceae bacterium]
MSVMVLLRHLLLISLICLPVAFLTAQTTLPKERNFEKLDRAAMQRYADTPVKGSHKRMRRARHFARRHLDQSGNLINHVQANLEALQQLYIDTFPGMIDGDWAHIGPLNTIGNDFNQEGVGRINHINIASATTWYAGTAGGGLWRTDVAGFYPGAGPYPWYPLTDSLPSIAISGISVHPSDVDDVHILTGDGESLTWGTRGTQPGIGILHSTDGGTTWNPTSFAYNMDDLRAGYKLIRYPGSVDTMFAACTNGLFRTTSAWTSSTDTFPVTGDRCYDIEFKPGDPQTIYAACKGALRRSTNGGSFFPDISGNLAPTSTPGTWGRMAIAVTPDNPELLYVMIAHDSTEGLISLQVSSDSGENFVELVNNNFNLLAANDPMTENDGQGNYDLTIWADPDDATTVVVGGVNVWKSTSGGLLWSEIANWTNEPPEYTHADIHAIETNPFNDDIVVGSDGGIYISSDGGLNWSNRGKGLGITQYYHLDVYTGIFGLPIISAGAQDNGTSTGIGFDDPVFEMMGGGDGFRTYRGVIDGDDVRYRSSQNGRLFVQGYFAGNWLEDEITPDSELVGSEGQGAWDTPYQPSPTSFSDLVAGYDDLYYSGDAGDDWQMLNVNHPSGSYDGSELIEQLGWSKNNTNVLYFYIADSTARHLWRCDLFYVGVITGTLNNADCSVIDLDTVPGMATNNPTDIALNPYNDDEIWLSFPGYADSLKVFYNPGIPDDS